jgi:hypothetical protein
MNIDRSRSLLGAPLYSYTDHEVLRPGPATHADPPKPQDVAEARQQMIQAGRKFEAYFISYLLKVMRETVPEAPSPISKDRIFTHFTMKRSGCVQPNPGESALPRWSKSMRNNILRHLPLST